MAPPELQSQGTGQGLAQPGALGWGGETQCSQNRALDRRRGTPQHCPMPKPKAEP